MRSIPVGAKTYYKLGCNPTTTVASPLLNGTALSSSNIWPRYAQVHLSLASFSTVPCLSRGFEVQFKSGPEEALQLMKICEGALHLDLCYRIMPSFWLQQEDRIESRIQPSIEGEQATVKCVASWTAKKVPSFTKPNQPNCQAENGQNLMKKGAGKPTIHGFSCC